MDTVTKLIKSKIMEANNETGIIRIGQDEASRLGLNIGDKISVCSDNVFVIRAAYEEDIKRFGDYILYVSKDDYAKVSECGILPENNVNPIKIGCDPEFVLTNESGKFMDASLIFSKYAALGSDMDLGEIRPIPSYKPSCVVEDIRKLILLMTNESKIFPIGTSYFNGRAVGFHLHFQIPKPLILFAPENTKQIIKNIVHVLDCFIGTPAVLFDEDDKRRLTSHEYGKPGDFRVSDNTLEYRTVGGVYLRHPLYTKRLLYTANIVMGNILANLEKNSLLWADTSKIQDPSYFCDMYGLPTQKEIKHTLSSPNRDIIHEMLVRIRKDFFVNIAVPDECHNLITNFLYLKKEKVGKSLVSNWTQ